VEWVEIRGLFGSGGAVRVRNPPHLIRHDLHNCNIWRGVRGGRFSSMSALRLKRDEAGVKLQGIAAATDDEWEELKTETEQVSGEV
jgi:hypothetical protein